jgi:hypothetical protein
MGFNRQDAETSAKSKTNPAASIADRNLSTVLSREARCLKSIDGVFTLAVGARPAVLQSRPARAARP